MESVMIFQFVKILQFSKVFSWFELNLSQFRCRLRSSIVFRGLGPLRTLLEGRGAKAYALDPPATFGCANTCMPATLPFPIGT